MFRFVLYYPVWISGLCGFIHIERLYLRRAYANLWGLILETKKRLYILLNSESNSFYFILFSFLFFKSLAGFICLEWTLDISEFNIHNFDIFPKSLNSYSMWSYIILISSMESRKHRNLVNKPGWALGIHFSVRLQGSLLKFEMFHPNKYK